MPQSPSQADIAGGPGTGIRINVLINPVLPPLGEDKVETFRNTVNLKIRLFVAILSPPQGGWDSLLIHSGFSSPEMEPMVSMLNLP